MGEGIQGGIELRGDRYCSGSGDSAQCNAMQ